MRSVEEHQRVVAGLIAARPAVTAELADAEGLVLSDDVTATVSLPGFDNSAMDGYAVRADEIASAASDHPVKLPVAEDIPAGRIDVPALAPGTAHLRTQISEGQALMRSLRGRVSGLCQPIYVLDIPGGHGKSPIGPNYLSEDGTTVTDFRGRRHRYPPRR